MSSGRLSVLDQARVLLATELQTLEIDDVAKRGTHIAKRIADELQLKPTERSTLVSDAQSIRYAAVERDAVLTATRASELVKRVAQGQGLGVPELKARLVESLREVVQETQAEGLPEMANACRAAMGGEVEKLLDQLQDMVGIDRVKFSVARLIEEMVADKMRQQVGLEPIKKKRNLRFEGPPGTGKTSVAKMLGKIYKAIGVTKTDSVKVVKGADLIAEYVGQTAPKTRKAFMEARGGILFIDEVQQLLHSRFGREAIEELNGLMTEFPDVIVIAAGYPEHVARFLKMDSGLLSRFNDVVPFDAYTPAQLQQIFLGMTEQLQLAVPQETALAARDIFDRVIINDTFGNGRFVEKCVGLWTSNQAGRLASLKGKADKAVVSTLLPEDVAAPNDTPMVGGDRTFVTTDELAAHLRQKVHGQDEATHAVAEAVMLRQKSKKATKATKKPIGFHMFLGPSGVGKTLLAETLADSCYGGKLRRVPCSELLSKVDVVAMTRGLPTSDVDTSAQSPLPDYIRQSGGRCVILFDEIDKADPSLFDMLMQVADNGGFLDADGRFVDCSNVHFILAGNLGNEQRLFEDVADGDYADPEGVRGKLDVLLERAFRTEFLGRLSEWPILFKPLSTAGREAVLDAGLDSLVRAQLQPMGFDVALSEAARAYLLKAGVRPGLGSRPLERLLERKVFLPIAERAAVEPEAFPEDSIIHVDFAKGALSFRAEKRTAPVVDLEKLRAEEARLQEQLDQVRLEQRLLPLVKRLEQKPTAADARAVAEDLRRIVHPALVNDLQRQLFADTLAVLGLSSGLTDDEAQKASSPALIQAAGEIALGLINGEIADRATWRERLGRRLDLSIEKSQESDRGRLRAARRIMEVPSKAVSHYRLELLAGGRADGQALRLVDELKAELSQREHPWADFFARAVDKLGGGIDAARVATALAFELLRGGHDTPWDAVLAAVRGVELEHRREKNGTFLNQAGDLLAVLLEGAPSLGEQARLLDEALEAKGVWFRISPDAAAAFVDKLDGASDDSRQAALEAVVRFKSATQAFGTVIDQRLGDSGELTEAQAAWAEELFKREGSGAGRGFLSLRAAARDDWGAALGAGASPHAWELFTLALPRLVREGKVEAARPHLMSQSGVEKLCAVKAEGEVERFVLDVLSVHDPDRLPRAGLERLLRAAEAGPDRVRELRLACALLALDEGQKKDNKASGRRVFELLNGKPPVRLPAGGGAELDDAKLTFLKGDKLEIDIKKRFANGLSIYALVKRDKEPRSLMYVYVAPGTNPDKLTWNGLGNASYKAEDTIEIVSVHAGGRRPDEMGNSAAWRASWVP